MNVLGILRGFPGLGRVVSGVSLLETLRDKHGCNIKIISYLQGNRYLESRGYSDLQEAIPMDYCSIGLLPTNKMGAYIHITIKEFKPDVVIIDGEPLIIHSLKISYPKMKIVALLNPADVDNPQNDKEAMDYFNAMYSLADLGIVHGLREIKPIYNYQEFLSIGTILRHETLDIKKKPSNNIYCVLGGGTVNAGHQFAESTIRIAELCQKVAIELPEYIMNIICSSQNIYDAINENYSSPNVIIHNHVLDATKYYSDAALIITRSGRNTLSELAYLGIPAISFISGCSFRKTEQELNVKNLSVNNIKLASLEIQPEDFVELCLNAMKSRNLHAKFCSGNDIAIQKLKKILKVNEAI